jgi:3-methyladenine DNA glycosylase/8-oxoguanine DNA glycosylase
MMISLGMARNISPLGQDLMEWQTERERLSALSGTPRVAECLLVMRQRSTNILAFDDVAAQH